VELRELELKPRRVLEFVAATTERAEAMRGVLPALRLVTLPAAGGALNVATQFRSFPGGHAERDAARASEAGDARWRELHEATVAGVRRETSSLFVEAPLVRDFKLHGLFDAAHPGTGPTPGCIYELRRYQLRLGYDVVPRFLELFSAGLPSKLGALGTDPTTSLVSLLYSDVGSLNEVIELWRHGGGTSAMEASRVAARSAAEWRGAVAEIAQLAVRFETAIHEPLPASPWR